MRFPNLQLPVRQSFRVNPKEGQRWKSRFSSRVVEVLSVNALGTEVRAQTVGSNRGPTEIHISTLREKFEPMQ